jgi:hypothetical protein
MADQKDWGVVAQFENPARLLEAATKLHASGYEQIESWSPFPVHGMDDAMGLSGSKVGWFTLTGGICGMSLAAWLQWWTGKFDYPIVIGGKPLFTWEYAVPVFFELAVLLSAIATLISIFALNKLPRPFHPLDRVPAFRRVTDDGFFLTIEASDPLYDPEKSQTVLAELGGTNITVVEE